MEAWIPGHAGRYSITDDGRVTSHMRGSPRPLKSNLNPRTGYLFVRLATGRVPREAKNYYVHSLVLETFVGPRPEGMVARHLDGDRLNPHLLNLKWGSLSDNMYDAVQHGTHYNARRTHCQRGHAYDAENTYHWSNGRHTRRYCRECMRSRQRKAA